jgi:O-antigen/teichoic acid export membrane protein
VGMFATFAGMGTGLTSAKHVAEFRQVDPIRAGRVVALSSLTAWITGMFFMLLLLASGAWLAAHSLAAPQLTVPIRVASIALLFGAVNGAQEGALNGFEAFKRCSMISVINGLISLPLMVGGVWAFGLLGAVCAFVASSGLACMMNFWALRVEAKRARVPLIWRGLGKEKDLLWRFSLPAVLSSAMVGPVLWMASTLIVRTPNGYAEMGVYSAANQWRTMILFGPALLAGVALPMLSNLRGLRDIERYQKLLWTNLKMSFLLSLAVAVPVALLAPWIMAGYGPSFSHGGWVLSTLCVAAVITATLNVIGQSIVSEGRMWVGFLLNSVWATVLLTVCAFQRQNGAMGLALANVIAYGVHLVTVTVYARQRLRSYALERR